MSPLITPPFRGIKLVVHQDRIELTAVYWVREFVGLGRRKADDVGPSPSDGLSPMYKGVMGDKDIWVVAVWRRFDDGREQAIRLECLDPETTEKEARDAFEATCRFEQLSKQELTDLAGCVDQASKGDGNYIESRFAEEKIVEPPDPKLVDEHDLYQARLKALAGMNPKTIELVKQADAAKDPPQRVRFERAAVQAFFAEMAHYWTEDLVLAWQRSNPVGTEWLCEFARVFQEPKREMDPINHELALNWLRKKYNLLTAEELSDAILIATQQRVMPGTLKKRRERLGLTTKRLPGPRPKAGQ